MAAVKQPKSIFNQSVDGYQILTSGEGRVSIDQTEHNGLVDPIPKYVSFDWRQIPDLIKRLQDAHMACCKHFDG